MEDIHLSKTPEPNSFHQIPDRSSPSSHVPPPPAQYVDGSPLSSAIAPIPVQTLDASLPFPPVPPPPIVQTPEDYPSPPTSPLHGEILDDPSNSSFIGCSETLEDDPSPSSPYPSVRNTLNLSSRWSEHGSSLWPSETEAEPSISPYVSNDTKPSLVGSGLANLGNTCFLNAVLQCFTHTVPLVQGLRSCNHKFPCDRGNEGFCVLCALLEHIELSLASSGGVVSPLKLVDNLSHFSSCFRRYQQEDAHEFLQCLLDKLDGCFLDSKTQAKHASSQDDNLVKQVFGGRLISKLQCCNCNRCSDSYESIIDLSLEIKDVDTLPCALESFTKVEKIGGPETKFTCESCKEEVSVEKQFMLDQAPSVAAFHLKRFKNDGFYVEKIDKHVAYPLELDLQPYVVGSQNSNVELRYELYAVVVHVGFSSTSGHYFCFIRSSPDTWHRLDDSKVTRVREDFVLSQEAYILFYARQGTPWFSSLMETEEPCGGSDILSTSPTSVLDNVDSISTFSPSVANIQSTVVNEVGYSADTISSMSSKIVQGGVEVNKVKADTHEIHVPMQSEAHPCSGGISYNVEKRSDPSTVEGNICNWETKKFGCNANIPQTPPGSPSPDIYSKEPQEESYLIPRDHLKLENHVSCKKALNKVLEDSKRREAVRLMKRSMPTARSTRLMAAMMGSYSEEALNKKSKRRMASPPNGVPSPRARRKSCPGPIMHPVAAGIFH